MFKVNFKAQTNIHSTPERIWQIITSNQQYQDWNTFTPYAEIEWDLGGKVILFVNMHPGKKPIVHRAHISILEKNRKVSWKMNWGFLLKAERTQSITELEDGYCVYYTDDVNAGLLAPIVNLLYGKKITEGFKSIARSLKIRAES